MINKGCCKREVNPSPHSPDSAFFPIPNHKDTNLLPHLFDVPPKTFDTSSQPIIFSKTFGYLINNSLLCTAFAQSLSREEILGMLRCNDKTI